MQHHAYVERVINLLDPAGNTLLNKTNEEALDAVASGDPARIRQIDGQFAILAQKGKIIRMARSIGRPMRYFLAKLVDGPCLIVAERIEEITTQLKTMGLLSQFHPSYTRMVPAHHLLELALLGCPDPNPTYTRFFAPQRNKLPANLDEIGKAYIGAVETELAKWLDTFDKQEPIGVLFSGGVASVMLGIATRAMEELAVLAQTKKPVQSSKTLAQSTLAQVDIARAEAGVRSARSFLHDSVRTAWDAVRRGDRVALETRLQARLAATHAGEQACTAVDLCYKAGGGTAVYATSPLQRCFRDIHTASAHVMVGSRVYETVGRHRFGLEIDKSSL